MGRLVYLFVAPWLLGVVISCIPKVQVQPPEEPIVIHLYVKIEHEIRVQVDEDLDQLFEEKGELF